MRLGLLSVISWMVTLTKPLFTVMDFTFSGRDLIMLVGGLFLLFKATTELHERLENRQHDDGHGKGYASFWVVVLQIVVLDAVFSLDAVITAVGMVNHLPVMMAAVVIVLGMKLVGSLLITALIVFPALGAMRLFKSFRTVTVFAGVFAVMAAVGGFLLSLVLSAPVGATMAVTDMVLFGICAAVGRMKN